MPRRSPGAPLISDNLPLVLADGRYPDGRRALLEGAMHAGAALAGAGLGLGHAMAQAVGGRYGIAHGAANAICLPPALRFNLEVAAAEIERFGEAMRTHDPIGRAEELVAALRDSRSCATSAFRGTTCPRWPKRPPSGAARRRTRALPQPTTFSGSSRASGEGTATSLSPSTARSSG